MIAARDSVHRFSAGVVSIVYIPALVPDDSIKAPLEIFFHRLFIHIRIAHKTSTSKIVPSK
jgi:hypothetical protein